MNKHILLLQLLFTASVFAQSPVITLNGDAVIEIYMGSTFVDPGATAYDEEDGDISNSIQVSGSVDTNTHGTYVLAYNVTDSDGNSAAVVVRTINVVDDARPSHELTINASLSGDDDVPDVGDIITYDIILSNTGNTDFVEYGIYTESIYLTDFNGNACSLTTNPYFEFSTFNSSEWSSIPGEQHFYTATFIITQQALDSGGLTLLLNADGYHPSASYSSTATNEFVFGTSSDEIILDGQISANNNQIKKLADPTDGYDATTKNYVDNNINYYYHVTNNLQEQVNYLLEQTANLQEQTNILNRLLGNGTLRDQDGNSYPYINYGEQKWTVKNAEVETYRDGTAITQVPNPNEWSNITTGAWCYIDNDPTKGKLYNWYAVAGIHDNDPDTPNKEFAPEGWRVPSEDDWEILRDFLIDNGFNYDYTTTGNKIGKAMASKVGWSFHPYIGSPGFNQNLNNSSGFNLSPDGVISEVNQEVFTLFGKGGWANIWSSTQVTTEWAVYISIGGPSSDLHIGNNDKRSGKPVRFVKN